MRILKCYVENFGLLRSADFSFTKGINCCLSDNGTGKTTLSAFIEAMLYGIGDTRRQMLDENPRKKYMPWQGGRYGGTLTLEVGKKKYTIERSFGVKAADDTFRLIDAAIGKECHDYTENIGEELFGIDRDGFLRTVFLSEKNLQGKNENKSISAKLSDLVGVDGDVGGFDDALKLLEDRRKFYFKKNNTGEIANVSEKISETRQKIDTLCRLENEIKAKKERLSAVCSERDRLVAMERSQRNKLSELSLKKERLTHEEAYASMIQGLKAEQIKLGEAEKFFGGRIPTLAQTDKARDEYIESRRLRDEALGDGGDADYVSLRSFFSSGTSFTEISEMESSAAELLKKESELERIRSGRDTLSIEQKTIFKGSAPTRDELIKAEGLGKRKLRLSPLKIGIAAIFSLIGIICVALGMINTSTPLIISGGVSLIIAGSALFIPSKSKELLAFCRKFSDDDASYAIALQEIRKNLERYEALGKEIASREEMLEESISTLKIRLFEFLGKFPGIAGSSISDAVNHIKAEYTRFYTLDMAGRIQENSNAEKLRRAEMLERSARDFVSAYPTVTKDPFSEIRTRLNEYNHLLVMVQRLANDCEAYAVKHGVTGKPLSPDMISETAVNNTLTELSERLNLINCEYTLLENEIRIANAEIERRDEYEMALADLEELLKKHTDSLDIIKKTSVLLKEACNNITSKYLGTTKERFEQYSKVITGTVGEFAISTDFEFAKTEKGLTHGADSYSRGMRDLYGIAMRFALIDALYDKEAPFIVLDDPFLALDDTKLDRAKSVLKELAKDKQIIYFTCSKVREIV